MNGRICLITGGNSGIGKESVVGLAKMGATVVIVCRDQSRGEAALMEIKERSGNDSVHLIIADLSSQKNIHKLVDDFKSMYKQLHVLINNAGVFLSKRTLTEDGIEATFAINHLAPFLLTNLLSDVLKASAPSRIVTVSSVAHTKAHIDFNDVQGERNYSGIRAYSQSKLANVLFTYELSRRSRGTAVTANCLHPGAVATNLVKSGVYGLAWKMMSPFMLSSEKGAETCIYLASSPEVENVTGKYFVKKKAVKSSEESYDESIARRLWQISSDLTGLV